MPSRAHEDVPRPAERTYEVSGPGGPVPVVEQGPEQGRADGPPILIVHGGTGDLTAWAPVADRLASRFRVLRYTRPTYRWHPAPRGSAALRAEIADALAVAGSVGEPALLVGHSSGAVVALETALTDQDSFTALALYEPPLGVIHTPAAADALRRARTAVDAGHPVTAMRIHLTEFVELPRRIVWPLTLLPPARRYFAPFADGQIADNELLEALPVGLDRFRGLALPTLLITGEKSPTHLRDRSARLAATLPGPAQRVDLAGQGHGANQRAPEELAAAIATFAAR